MKEKIKEIVNKIHEFNEEIMESCGYCLIEKSNKEKNIIRDRYLKQAENIRAEFYSDIRNMEDNYKKQLRIKDKALKELESAITNLKNLIKEKTTENSNLKEEIETLKDKMSKMYTLEQIRSRKPKSTQKMNIRNSNAVRSRIARDTVKELEKVEEN